MSLVVSEQLYKEKTNFYLVLLNLMFMSENCQIDKIFSFNKFSLIEYAKATLTRESNYHAVSNNIDTTILN